MNNRRLVARALLCGAATVSLAAPAFAQDAPAAAQPEETRSAAPEASTSEDPVPVPAEAADTSEDIVVTGTLFRRTKDEQIGRAHV